MYMGSGEGKKCIKITIYSGITNTRLCQTQISIIIPQKKVHIARLLRLSVCDTSNKNKSGTNAQSAGTVNIT